MTESKKQQIADKAKKSAAKTGSELSETDLHKASGGAYDAFRSITDGTRGAAGGGGGIAGQISADKKGSV
jgi:hypothetical protein